MKIVSSLVTLLLAAAMSTTAGETFYLGTYTAPGKSRGIYRYELDPATGAVQALGLAVETESPSFLARHPTGKFLYAVNEISQGTVSAFALQPDGKLKELNKQSSRGGGPTHIALDHAGRHALAANYNSGSVVCLPIHADGALGEATGFMQEKGSGPDKQRQQGPHAHSVYVSGDDRHVFSCDLGLDRIFKYDLAMEKGSLSPGDPPFTAAAPGSGPRHLALTAGEKRIYMVQEMANTITVLEREAGGSYREIQRIGTLPGDFHGESSTAEIMLHPNGRFLYCSNRGHDSIASFAVNEEDGKLTLLGHTPVEGKSPRFFTFDPTGNFLLAANQSTNNVAVLRVDAKSGGLKFTGHSFQQDQPVCLVFTGK